MHFPLLSQALNSQHLINPRLQLGRQREWESHRGGFSLRLPSSSSCFVFCELSFFLSFLLVKFVKWLSLERLQEKTWGSALRDCLGGGVPHTLVIYLEMSGEGSTGRLEASQTLVLQIPRSFQQNREVELWSSSPAASLWRARWGACLVGPQGCTGWGWLDPKDHSSNTLLPPSRSHPLYCQSSLQTNRVLVH